ncbi:hypothetical protein [Cytobacillus oceanisediminis]|uniref:hypothetical protein n=1 Tax=Cytobacillus oceanisediminis TaxID=665099 RepID=UPI0031F44E5E
MNKKGEIIQKGEVIREEGVVFLADLQMVEFDTKLLEGTGSFCLRSKKDSLGYISKNK